jgi:hypothetical protein
MRWCEEGLDPRGFWLETPRTFLVCMEGRVHAAQRKREEDIMLAYNILLIKLDNQKGRMKPLSKYLPSKPVVQSADDVANIFLSLKAKGRSVKIRERKRA